MIFGNQTENKETSPNVRRVGRPDEMPSEPDRISCLKASLLKERVVYSYGRAKYTANKMENNSHEAVKYHVKNSGPCLIAGLPRGPPLEMTGERKV